MKKAVKWRRINTHGLGRYEISNVMTVKFLITREDVPIFYKDNNPYVELLSYKVKKVFSLNALFRKTFPETNFTPYIKTSSESQFSKDEDDYGKGRNSIYWSQLKELIYLQKIVENERLLSTL